MIYGASPTEWAVLSMVLDLTEDLLPVVSNPTAKISPNSSLLGAGKVPSVYNRQKMVVGISKWTEYVASEDDLKKWTLESDYGVCIQTRRVRALDIDVTDKVQAEAIEAAIRSTLGVLPTRRRSNSTKFLVMFYLEGVYTKRSFKTEHGIVENLASGQQFIALGTHTSGVKYVWDGGLPSTIPTVTPEQFESLWTELVDAFAIEAPQISSATSKKEKLNAAITTDPVAAHLGELGIVKSAERDGRLHIICPFEAEHTTESSDSATTYFPANTGGYAQGHFDCRHAHCAQRTDEEFKRAIGYDDLEFDDLTDEAAVPEQVTPSRYHYISADEYVNQPPLGYLIKGLIPRVEMVMLFGPPQGGKSFLALDMAAHIALGTPWRGHRVKRGRVCYIAAEGAGGLVNRIAAYKNYHGVDSLDVFVLPASPNFMNAMDIKELITATVALAPSLIVIDTWAQSTAGGNENSGEDMGKALAQAKKLHRATKATCLIVHHSGKDAERGARGWSGLLGAADAMLEIRRNGDDRVMTNTKQKDGTEGQEYGFKLNVVHLGEDADGDPITSCVVLESAVTRAEVNMGKNEKLILKALEDSRGLDGEWPDVNTVIDAALLQIPFDATGGKNDKRRQNVRRALKSCIEKELLEEIDGRLQHVNSKQYEKFLGSSQEKHRGSRLKNNINMEENSVV